MSQVTYLKCRNAVMTFVDPETRFQVPRGKIVPVTGKLSRTMQKWIRRGGLVVVDEALYLTQQKADLTVPVTEVPVTAETEPTSHVEITQDVVSENAAPVQESDSNDSTESAPDESELEPKAKKSKKKSGGNP